MSWRYTNEELNRMSGIQYQSLQDNPWKETGMNNIFVGTTYQESSFDEFGEENALDNILGNINLNNKYLMKDEWFVGDTLLQKDLSSTLELIKRHGRSGFYAGEIADKIINICITC